MRRETRRARRYFTRDPVFVIPAVTLFFFTFTTLLLLTATTEAQGSLVIALLFLSPLPVVAARASTLGVRIDDDAVEIVNMFRRYRIPREQVERFELERTPHGAIAAVAYTSDGRRVVAGGIQHRWLSSVRKGETSRAGRIVDALNAELGVR